MALTNLIYTVAGGVIVGVVLFIINRISKNRDTKTAAEIKALEDAKRAVEAQNLVISELKEQVAVLIAKAIPIDAAYAAMLIAKMTHLHTPVMDALLKKMGNDLESNTDAVPTLTMEDAENLDAGLREKINDPNLDEAERIAARILPDVARLAVLAKEKDEKNETETVLVTIPTTQPASTTAGEAEEEK